MALAFDGCGSSLHAIPRVSLAALRTSTQDWELAVECLANSLIRHHVCVITVPEETRETLEEALSLYGAVMSDRKLTKECTTSTGGNIFHTLPGRCTLDYRKGGCIDESLPRPVVDILHKVFDSLDSMARLLLGAVCRSSHIRLRSDTFLRILDDMPLMRGSQSAAMLQVVKCSSKLLTSCDTRRGASSWSLTGQQEGATYKSMLTLIAAREAQHAVGAVSKLQVKNAGGQWADVPLAAGEVAVVFGQTAAQASAGLFTPAMHRVVRFFWQGLDTARSSVPGRQCTANAQVGDLLEGMGRASFEFQLHAQPDAVVDFRTELREAGHDIPGRFAAPVAMRQLMTRFDELMTPEAAALSRQSVELGSLDTAMKYQRKKRVAKELTFASSPVTRSGKVRRTSNGAVGKCSLFNKERAAAEPEAAGSPSKGEEAAAEAPQAERTYIIIDGKGRKTDDFLSISLLCTQPGACAPQVRVRAHPKAALARIFEVYSQTMGLELRRLVFISKGVRLSGGMTLYDAGILDGEVVSVVFNGPLDLPCEMVPSGPSKDDEEDIAEEDER